MKRFEYLSRKVPYIRTSPFTIYQRPRKHSWWLRIVHINPFKKTHILKVYTLTIFVSDTILLRR